MTIYDLTSVYVSRKKTKDTLGSKDYHLTLRGLAIIKKLQEIADRLNIANLDLIESTRAFWQDLKLNKFEDSNKNNATFSILFRVRASLADTC